MCHQVKEFSDTLLQIEPRADIYDQEKTKKDMFIVNLPSFVHFSSPEKIVGGMGG